MSKAYSSLDIINARVPSCNGLQKIEIAPQGKVSQILPMSLAEISKLEDLGYQKYLANLNH